VQQQRVAYVVRQATSALSVFTLLVVIACGKEAYAQAGSSAKGCPIEVAVQQVDEFVTSQSGKISGQSMPLLNEMAALSSKATKPGVAIGDQLSQQDRDRFSQLTHANIQLTAERVKFSDFLRDVHVIYDTYKVAELADLYEVTADKLGKADPRRFYLLVLQGLRIAQPRTMRTPLINVGIGCDPEAGLYFQEEISQQQLAKSGADQHTVNLVFDIERLRTLYQLAWNLFNKGIDDVRGTTWKGNNAVAPDNITPMVAASSAVTQNMYKTVIPFIDEQFPSEGTLEMRFMQEQNQLAQHDYPVRGK
jgi:hypothetical protein